jgi:predicted transcriptional regulator
MPRGKYKRNPDRHAAARERLGRMVRAYALREEGFKFAEIAELMGHSQSYVHALYRAMAERIELPPEEEALKLMVSRYDRLLQKLFGELEQADAKETPGLTREIRSIEKDRLAALGYAKPTRVQLLNGEHTDAACDKYKELIALERAAIRAAQEQRQADRKGYGDYPDN